MTAEYRFSSIAVLLAVQTFAVEFSRLEELVARDCDGLATVTRVGPGLYRARARDRGGDVAFSLPVGAESPFFCNGAMAYLANGDAGVSELMIKSNGRERKLVSGPFLLKGRRYVRFVSPQISADCKFVFFLTNFGDTSYDLLRANMTTGDIEWIAGSVLDYLSIDRGSERLNLAVQLRRPKAQGIVRDFWLLSGSGTTIRYLGPEENSTVTRFWREHLCPQALRK